MSLDEWDEYENERYREEAAYEDMFKDRSEEAVRYHLGTVGDAIEARVQRCLDDARRLLELEFYGPALVCAVGAIELIIRFLLVRPLVSGAFLSEEWESILAEKIGSGNTSEDRRILPAILSGWGIKLDSVLLPDGKKLWTSLVDAKSGVLGARNRVVHQGAVADEMVARRALDCAETMIQDLVRPIGEKFGFTVTQTGRWCEVQVGSYTQKFTAWDPIEGKAFEVIQPHKRRTKS